MNEFSLLFKCFLFLFRSEFICIFSYGLVKRFFSTLLFCNRTIKLHKSHRYVTCFSAPKRNFLTRKSLRRNPPGLRVLHGQNYVPKLFTSYCKLLCYRVKYTIIINHFKQHQTSKTNFAIPLNSSESLKRLFYKIATLEILPIIYMVLVNFEIHFLSQTAVVVITASLAFKNGRK